MDTTWLAAVIQSLCVRVGEVLQRRGNRKTRGTGSTYADDHKGHPASKRKFKPDFGGWTSESDPDKVGCWSPKRRMAQFIDHGGVDAEGGDSDSDYVDPASV